MNNRLPNFLYIGPGKAGSTWLHEILLRHPQVYLTAAKDLYFFDRYFDRGLDWYQSQFRQARPEHRVIGEVCPHYLFSEDVPRRISESLGRVQLMFTIREPVARTFSSYLYMRKNGEVRGSFQQTLQSRPSILNPSRYATHINRYLEYFDKSEIYCGVFDDLIEDPQSFLDPLLAWLGVDPMTLDQTLRESRLPASQARSTKFARAVRETAAFARRHRAAKLIGYMKRSPVVNQVLYRPLDEGQPRVSPEEALFVREALEGEIAEVEQMFGVDLRRRWMWI